MECRRMWRLLPVDKSEISTSFILDSKGPNPSCFTSHHARRVPISAKFFQSWTGEIPSLQKRSSCNRSRRIPRTPPIPPLLQWCGFLAPSMDLEASWRSFTANLLAFSRHDFQNSLGKPWNEDSHEWRYDIHYILSIYISYMYILSIQSSVLYNYLCIYIVWYSYIMIYIYTRFISLYSDFICLLSLSKASAWAHHLQNQTHRAPWPWPFEIPENRPKTQKGTIVFQPPLFSGRAVSFREFYQL